MTLEEAIKEYKNGSLLLHRSAENEKYTLRVTAQSWLERRKEIKINL